jgi:hypothetical protein
MQIVFHIGQQKTASSTIQTFLAHNRTELAARKVLYPRAFGETKATLISDFVTDAPRLADTSATIRANLTREFAGDFAKAIISNENLITSKRGAIPGRLKETFAPYATSWRVLCYVRRPDEHIVSQYQQKVRGGYVGTFDQFFDHQLNSQYYGYAHWLDRWAEIFGEGVVEARVFHRKTLQGSPVDDFVQWLGLEREGLSEEAQGHVKESLDRMNTEILRFLHLCQVEAPDLLGRHDVKRMLQRLGTLDTGARQRLDTDRALRLQERVRADHARLAQRYLSPEHAAVLLAPPAEVPPQPPLDRDMLFERMMALFDDADLARRAVAGADQPSDRGRTPGKLLHPKKRSKVERVMQRQGKAGDRKPRAAQDGIAKAAGRGKEGRSAGGARKRPMGLLQRLKAYWRSGSLWPRSGGK